MQKNQLKGWADLQQRRQIKAVKKEVQAKGLHQERITGGVYGHPYHRIKIVRLETTDGREVHIPLKDLIQAEMEDGVTIFSGRVDEKLALGERGGKRFGTKKGFGAR
ncbi:hypothetical protein ACFO25_06250 [Paenactinomyces guangxiensis]|uniref:Uncharacterized protein n=1 Tax=Paenactinomyces guangxiensis TaxID=1490290 RepID=A0A7W2AA21_9BACL|nr:hypothetical protein [Paenactinomyces guangxiensis]MBA4496325.1 hypothetical protein [Paenactinomyces guangxiensis]MBH8590854.1 hypothetical protein [Paenactinomyces guangxiensis]